MAILADRYGWTEAQVDETIWFNVQKYCDEARKMKAVDTIKAIIIARGNDEVLQHLREQALSELGEPEDNRTPLELKIDALTSEFRMICAQPGGGHTEDAKQVFKRIEYLKAMKRAGRTDG